MHDNLVLSAPKFRHPSSKGCLNIGADKGRAVTNVVRTCSPTNLLVFDFMRNEIHVYV